MSCQPWRMHFVSTSLEKIIRSERRLNSCCFRIITISQTALHHFVDLKNRTRMPWTVLLLLHSKRKQSYQKCKSMFPKLFLNASRFSSRCLNHLMILILRKNNLQYGEIEIMWKILHNIYTLYFFILFYKRTIKI